MQIAEAALQPSESTPQWHERVTGQRADRLFIVRYIVGLAGLWIALLTPASVTLAIRVSQLDPVGKTSSLAFIASLGAAAALFANPIFGFLSDRCRSPWGRRRPFILGGMSGGALSVAAIGFAPNIGTVAVLWVLAQASFNAAVAAMIAVFPERVPAELRGRVSGFMGAVPQCGIVGGTLLAQLVGTQGYGMFVWPALIGLALILPFLGSLKEAPAEQHSIPPTRAVDLVASLWVNPLVHRDFALAWLGRFFTWLSLYQLTTYKTYFLIDRLGYTPENVAPVLTLSMFVLAATVVMSSIPGGWLSDLIGRRKVFVVFASLVFVAAMCVVAVAQSVTTFVIAIAVSGIGMGLYLGVDYALVAQLLPKDAGTTGRFMGVFNLSTAIPQTLAPVLAPMFLSIGAAEGHGNYAALYLAAAALAAVGAIVTQFIRAK